jgi:signal transduction histidine kinase
MTSGRDPSPDSLPDVRSLTARLRAVLASAAPGGETVVETSLLKEAVATAEMHQGMATRFEERVAEARLEALRELAYGAGHEINNPLANIAARAQALLLDEREPERRRRLATIVDQAFRARDMIGGLMLFARPPKPELGAACLEDVVRPVLDTLRPQAEIRRIRFDYTPSPTPLRFQIDAAQVGEALRMLTVNAFEAVNDGGWVCLEAVSDAANDWAHVSVIDNGPGMDSETAARACDPFFSGREAGRGIGLGLPKALRLVEANGGRLTIASRPGRGTRCTVALPLDSRPR